jgi:DegV family protein with EDD domain
MSVHIVTDSTADLPQSIADAYGITVVPLKVMFGMDTYRDKVDITESEFYSRLTSSRDMPKTSQPSSGEFEDVYRRLLADGSPILSVHLSAKLSGTLNSAQTAAAAVANAGEVRTYDTQQASMALGFVAMLLAHAAKHGARLDELEKLAEQASKQTQLLFFVDTLEYLQRGGRIGRASALIGSLLNVKAILKLEDGEVRPVERVRTRSKAIERVCEWISGLDGSSMIGLLGSPPLEDRDKLADFVRARIPSAKIYETVLGPVVGTHTGPGVLGVVSYEGPPFD